MRAKLIYVVTEDWYFCGHRLPLAVAAKAAGYDVLVVTRVQRHGEIIRDAGLALIPLEFRRSGTNPLLEIFTVIRLARIYRRERPSLVHHVALKPAFYGSLAARLCPQVRVVNYIAGMGWLFGDDKGRAGLLRSCVRWMLGRALRGETVLVENPDDTQLLRRMGVEVSDIRRVAGSGVDLVRFKPVPELAGIPLIVLPARLLWDKGVGEFVAAARILRSRGVAARFMLAGQPDEANPASVDRRQLVDWVDEGIVEYPGWIEDMPGLLAASHIVCLPSFYREGLPMALIEASAMGRAIVTTDSSGCREVVRDGDNGLLVPPRDAAALAAALERLISDPALRRRMGARGRMRAEQEYGLDRVIAQTLDVYRELIP